MRLEIFYKVVAALAVTVFGVVTAQAATLEINPPIRTVNTGDTFDVPIILTNTPGHAIDGVEVKYLNYPTNLLDVVDSNTATAAIEITPNAAFLDTTFKNLVDTSLGQIFYSRVGSDGVYYTSTAPITVATVTFRAKQTIGTANLNFNFTLGIKNDSNVISSNLLGQDLLTSVVNGTVNIQGAGSAPVITQQPASATVTAPNTATFTVAATGTAPLSYQWRRNGANIAGATGASYTTPATSVAADNGAMFSVIVSNGIAPNATSNNATLTVNPAAVAPTITQQPASATVTAPATATFTVAATGTAPLSYQWRRNGANIAGATGSSYTTPATSVAADNGAMFSVVVSNGTLPNATSNNATLTVNPAAVAPTITQQPVSKTVTAPATATFTVAATGTAPLSYQWRRNGANIAGATGASYTTPATSVAADNGAMFSVVVSNGTLPNATSNNATLTVNPASVAPTITQQPASATVTAPNTATFTVAATGTAPLSYQWRRNGANIAGATGASYTTPATSVAADNGAMFSVVVSNGTLPNATSNNATLTVNPAAVAPTITQQPTSATVTAPATATFTVAATGTAPLSYQWRRNGANIAGATGASYTTPATSVAADNGAMFSVVVSNGTLPNATSSNATLTVSPAPVAPTITQQPASATVTAPNTVTFTVAATGTAPLSYQWRRNGANIAGAIGASYTTPATSVAADNGAMFSVVVSNGTLPNATSNNATLTVNPLSLAPMITQQPANQSVTAPATATFTVAATGTAPLSYQWRRNGANIAGANSSSYTTPATSVAADNGAMFSVVVSNGTLPNATSNSATLTVSPAPVAPTITQQPMSQTKKVGETAMFCTAATGTAPLSYQWRKNGANMAGATSACYTTPVLALTDSGSLYSCIVSNGVLPNAITNNATLTVIPADTAPVITQQPASQSVTAPATATFTVAATGTAPLSYQWRRNGANIAGATGSSYTTPATSVAADNGAMFSVVVSNGTLPNATSNNATLTVNPAAVAPTITQQPVSKTVTAPATATFTVAATGTAPLSYQWRRNGANIAGATGASYTTPATSVAADNGAMFSVVVSNGTLPNATSNNATLTVNPASVAPTITQQPASATVTAPATATFTVAATGTAPLSYQWRRNGANIAGATGASYTTPATSVAADNGAMFSVVVSNGTLPNATSSNATLTVNPASVAPTITQQPVSKTVTAPATATFSVTATGTAPLSYQWRRNGANIFGATGASYTTPATSVAADNGAMFSVVVSNGTLPNATSSNATLTVGAAGTAPTITTQPASQSIVVGQTATFTVAATGTAPLMYQWRRNGTNIAGATSASYTTPAAIITDNAAMFSVVVSNGTLPNATSSNATLTVGAATAPSIITQPVSKTVSAGLIATFTVAASGSEPMKYQWRKNTQDIPGANLASYSTPATTVADSGSIFSVFISNAAGSTTSMDVTLTVNAGLPPTILTQPKSTTVTAGQTASFIVVATGSLPLSYQWMKDGINIAGATNAAYQTPTTVIADNGALFTVKVTNSVNSVTSTEAMLTVLNAILDTDADGIPDTIDNCPKIANPDQADKDMDKIGNLCDNCVRKYNPDQTDTNGNRVGDVCERKRNSCNSPTGTTYIGLENNSTIALIDAVSGDSAEGESDKILPIAEVEGDSSTLLGNFATDAIEGKPESIDVMLVTETRSRRLNWKNISSAEEKGITLGNKGDLALACYIDADSLADLAVIGKNGITLRKSSDGTLAKFGLKKLGTIDYAECHDLDDDGIDELVVRHTPPTTQIQSKGRAKAIAGTVSAINLSTGELLDSRILEKGSQGLAVLDLDADDHLDICTYKNKAQKGQIECKLAAGTTLSISVPEAIGDLIGGRFILDEDGAPADSLAYISQADKSLKIIKSTGEVAFTLDAAELAKDLGETNGSLELSLAPCH